MAAVGIFEISGLLAGEQYVSVSRWRVSGFLRQPYRRWGGRRAVLETFREPDNPWER